MEGFALAKQEFMSLRYLFDIGTVQRENIERNIGVCCDLENATLKNIPVNCEVVKKAIFLEKQQLAQQRRLYDIGSVRREHLEKCYDACLDLEKELFSTI